MLFVCYILVFGLFLALLEIEIEGEYGWAKNLPTWRIQRKSRLSFLRTITGYHTLLFSMILFLNHVVYIGFFGWSNIGDELLIVAFHIFLTTYWDFLWFVLNPHFTYKKFSKKYIPWYSDSTWLAGFPLDYWYSISLSGMLIGFNCLVYGYSTIVPQFFMMCILGIFIWAICTIISPLYHRLYYFLRK